MFELFGSSSEKKEEIDKNVEEIRSMVEGSKEPQDTSQQATPVAPQSRQDQPPGGQNQSEQRPGPAQQQQESLPRDGPGQERTSHPPSRSQSQQGPQASSEQNTQQRQKPQQEQARQQQRSARPQEQHQTPDRPEPEPDDSIDDLPPPPGAASQDESTSSDQEEPIQAKERFEPERNDEQTGQTSRNRPDIPEAPKTKEINVPDIEKGPLFIRVKKFKEAKKLIHQMQDLSEDVETDMGGLQNTLEEDKDIQNDLKGRLKKLQDSMKSIESIVSP